MKIDRKRKEYPLTIVLDNRAMFKTKAPLPAYRLCREILTANEYWGDWESVSVENKRVRGCRYYGYAYYGEPNVTEIPKEEAFRHGGRQIMRVAQVDGIDIAIDESMAVNDRLAVHWNHGFEKSWAAQLFYGPPSRRHAIFKCTAHLRHQYLTCSYRMADWFSCQFHLTDVVCVYA